MTAMPPDLPEPWAEVLHGYLALVDRHLGHRVLAVELLGPPGSLRPPLRSVLVLDRVELEALRALGAQGLRLSRRGVAPSLIMTPEFIARSLDTFPLELLEIQQQHVTVRGEDYFSPLRFTAADVRRQCERELKAISVGMRQGLLAAGMDDAPLGDLQPRLVESVLRVLRGILWLGGQTAPAAVFGLVADVEHRLGATLPGVCAALDDANAAWWHKFQELYHDLEVLGQFVDGLPH